MLDPPTSVKLSQLLIHQQADVNARDRDSNTPLHLCALCNDGIWPARLELGDFFARFLTMACGDLSSSCSVWLFFFFDLCFLYLARLLLAYKADPALRNCKGLLPSDLILCHTVPCAAADCEAGAAVEKPSATTTKCFLMTNDPHRP